MEKEENQNVKEREIAEDQIDFRALLFKYIIHWPWFIGAVLLCFVGAKTAQRLIIELKDKLKVEEAFEMALNNRNKANAAAEQDNSIIVMNDAVEALVSLGYSSKDAIKAVKKVDDIDKKNSEAILKEALKSLATL